MQNPKESLVVHNPNHEIVTFRLDKGLDDDIASKSRHKQRRLIRALSHNVALPSRQSVDLVVVSGLTLKEIKDSPEYLQMQNRFQVMHDSSLVVEPVEEVDDTTCTEVLQDMYDPSLVDGPVEVDPIDVDDIDGVQLEDKVGTLDEVLQDEYPDAVVEPEVVIEEPVEAPVEEPEDAEPKELTTETKAQHEELAQELIDSGAEELELPGKEPVYDEHEPEPEPEPEPVEEPVAEVKPAPKKAKRKAKKKVAKKATKRGKKS